MRKILISGLVLLNMITLSGQSPFPSKEEINQFQSSKTCVVLEDDSFSAYNKFIRDAVKEYWEITPFEFIEEAEFNVRRADPAYSFIVLTQTNFEKDKANSVYNYINLIQGKKVARLGLMPEICAVPLSFAGEEDLEYVYKLGAILSFMQKHARMIIAEPALTGRRYLRYYNRFIPDIKGKTILVRKEDLAPEISTAEAIKALYGGKIEIVPEEEIIKAIGSRAPGTLVLHKVGPGKEKKSGYCFKMLIGTDDANMYYYNQHVIDSGHPDGLLPDDLKRLAK
jgi:hypothetical protein